MHRHPASASDRKPRVLAAIESNGTGRRRTRAALPFAAIVLSLLLGMLACPSTSSADISMDAASLSPRRNSFQPWLVFRSLKVTDSSGMETKITQMSAPVSFNWRIAPGFSALLYGAFANTSLEPQSGGSRALASDTVSLSGVTDVRAKLFYSGMAGMVISLGVSLPSGKHSLTEAEEPVANAAAFDVLGFRVRRFGEGFDFEGGITRAFEAGDYGAFALGVGYLAKGEYEYREGLASKYKPGSELSASAGYDYRTPATLVRLNAAFRGFSRDAANSVKSFQQGSQIVLEERWVATRSSLTNDLAVHQLLKGESKTYGADDSSPAGLISNGSSFGVAERLELGGAAATHFAALVDGNFYGKSAGHYDSARLLGFGGELSIAPSSGSVLRLQGRILSGSTKPGDVKIKGFDAGAALRVAF